jgi:MFS transporter, BCD family, chlorophyll transporter
VILSAPLHSPALYGAGAFLVGMGGGYFSIGTLTAVMTLAKPGYSGLAIGAWGAVQATAAGLAIAFAGIGRDGIAAGMAAGWFGYARSSAGAQAGGYLTIFTIEIVLLFATLAVIGPLARFRPTGAPVFPISNLPFTPASYGKGTS